VLSPDEVRRLLAAAPGFEYRLLLSLTYGCGLRGSEMVSLKVSDIDSAQMVIRIEQGKGRQGSLCHAAASLARDAAAVVDVNRRGIFTGGSKFRAV
jgi:integrase